MGPARLGAARGRRRTRRRAGRPVSAPAVGGQATEAALTAVAAALGVRRHAVTLIAGASSRTKIVEVEGADSGALNRLLANAGHGDPT